MKKSCSLNIKSIILKTVLFYSRYVQLGSVIYPALIGHSFPSIWEIFCRKPLSKTCKNEGKRRTTFLFVFLPSNNDIHMHSCILSSWENGIPLTKLFILGGRLFHSPKRIARAKAFSSHCCKVNTLGKLAHDFSTFFKVSRRNIF